MSNNILMNPVLINTANVEPPVAKSQIEPGNESSFTDHMDKEMRSAQSDKKNLLGVQDTNTTNKKGLDHEKENLGGDKSVAALLQQLMANLKDLANEPGRDAGEWSFQLDGLGLLEQLAGQAGMDIEDLSLLQKQMEEKGSLFLTDLFAALEKHFMELGQDMSVTAPETDLPLLETFLSRMGMDPGQLKELAGQGVDGLGQLDLMSYLEGLNNQADEDLQPITLTDWEFEQLQGMLASAGVSEGMIEKMFGEKPTLMERALADMNLSKGNVPVELSFDRLKDMLEQAIAAVDLSRSKANLPGFLENLQTVLSQAGFQSQDVGWSPVVQESITAMYQELQKMIDLAKVKVEKGTQIAAINDELVEQWQSSGKMNVDGDTAKPQMEMMTDQQNAVELEAMGSALEKTDDGFAKVMTAAPDAGNISGDIVRVAVDRGAPAPGIRLTPEIQQFTVEQISQGVARGLRNNQHHLTLTLYPKELGEVKVDLQIRGSQLSVNFMMDNFRVKEALESNMEDFKGSLEKHGFTLGELAVSVDQNNSDDTQQGFDLAWEKMMAQQGLEKNPIEAQDLPHITNSLSVSMNQGSISLFV